jgi:hypothetical protein
MACGIFLGELRRLLADVDERQLLRCRGAGQADARPQAGEGG